MYMESASHIEKKLDEQANELHDIRAWQLEVTGTLAKNTEAIEQLRRNNQSLLTWMKVIGAFLGTIQVGISLLQ